MKSISYYSKTIDFVVNKNSNDLTLDIANFNSKYAEEGNDPWRSFNISDCIPNWEEHCAHDIAEALVKQKKLVRKFFKNEDW